LGSIPEAGSGWTVSSTVDALTGQIGITLWSLTPIGTNLSGSLVTIDFHAQPGLAVGPSAIQLAASVDPHGQGSYVTGAADSNGAMILGIAPTNTINPALEGTVVVLSSPLSVVTVMTTHTGVAGVEPEDRVTALPEAPLAESSSSEQSPPGTEAHQTQVAHGLVQVGNLVSQAAQTALSFGTNMEAQAQSLPPSSQPFADRLFPAVARSTADLGLVGNAAQEEMNQFLGSQVQGDHPAWDLDDLELSGDVRPTLSLGSHGQVEPTHSAPGAPADAATLTEYFARLADDDNEVSEDNSAFQN
jgi:hypothetical protein